MFKCYFFANLDTVDFENVRILINKKRLVTTPAEE